MRNTIKLALLAAVFVGTQASAASLQNGDFATTSLAPGWTATGNASVNSLLAAPSGKPFQAFIGNAGASLYGFGPGSAMGEAALSAALGLPAGGLDSLKQPGDVGNVVLGSAIQQSFTANAGDQISFNWNFLSDESSNANGNDFAFLLFDGTLTRLANTFTASGPTLSVFTYETGFKSMSFALPASGAHSIAFGVVDVDDALGASALLVDNVTVTAVPEPSSVMLLLAGLALVGVTARRRIAALV